MSRYTQFFLFLPIYLLVVAFPQTAAAHRSGCHNLHTCSSDSNTYICGDLGYPCNGATSINDIAPEDINVPLLVESTFVQTFGRKPTDAESTYWKNRFRNEKDSVYKIRRAMAWHQVNGSFGPPKEVSDLPDIVPHINALFRSVYDGRNPTVAENHYWLTRITDKPTQQAMMDAMLFHKLNNIQH